MRKIKKQTKKHVKNITSKPLILLWHSFELIKNIILWFWLVAIDLIKSAGVVGSLVVLIIADLLGMENLYKRAEKLLTFFDGEVEDV